MEKALTDHAEPVEALVKTGVRLVAKENTIRRKSIPKDDLLPGVGKVPSGAVEVFRKQQKDGYDCFMPRPGAGGPEEHIGEGDERPDDHAGGA